MPCHIIPYIGEQKNVSNVSNDCNEKKNCSETKMHTERKKNNTLSLSLSVCGWYAISADPTGETCGNSSTAGGAVCPSNHQGFDAPSPMTGETVLQHTTRNVSRIG